MKTILLAFVYLLLSGCQSFLVGMKATGDALAKPSDRYTCRSNYDGQTYDCVRN